MYPLCMLVGSSGQGKVLPQEDWVPGGHVALLRGKTTVFRVWLWRIVLRLKQKFELQLAPQRHNELLKIGYFKDSCAATVDPVVCNPLTPNHCRLRREWCQARAHWRTKWRSVVF
ncbi:hypothetical protein AVEN_93856-1 [Araneus ventricosus]|uniref:Uncharacterized protein n=1 Tax=Araneus ventricosus TaxID=182803 RepID=A0A4Y2AZ24_ARAVE|nr:hypothetical protein AVEN_93856-1 [Araneus ventricosus]